MKPGQHLKFCVSVTMLRAVAAFWLTLIGAQGVAQNAWVQKDFILGTFFDPPVDIRARNVHSDSARFALAKEAHFNLLTGTQGEGGIDRSFEGMRHGLRIAQKVKMKYLVSDNRFFEAYNHSFQESEARSISDGYQRLPSDLRSVLYGYFLCDEPRFMLKHLERVKNWKSHFDQRDPAKLVYVNFVASYAADANWDGFAEGNRNDALDEPEREQYEQYLHTYNQNVNPAVISFDHYPFFANGKVRNDYFYNLQIIRDIASGKPFWAMPMTSGHLSYVDPTEAHIAFMYFCPLAYGAKGLIDFTFWPPDERDYRNAPIDREGCRTDRFWIIRKLNLFVTKIVAPVIMGSTSAGVYHASRYPGNQVYLSDSTIGRVEGLASVGDARILVGAFHQTKAVYYLVVNKSLNPLSDVRISLKGKRTKVHLSPRYTSFTEQTSLEYRLGSAVYSPSARVTTVRIPELAGGEGRVVRVKQ
jgi:hypothetical protein